ncbi:sensor domain-containing diguanylate cyclase [Desulfobotulus mexicanus]|uniref:diguanylate cyclase n=1 Tax=Desulfobotulus mexicanus TaxID=2586642 RepID=A0A5S5MFR3_9BACT|nr:sensor domain-containing diguanylate cyclase [Desulfobotulus mexicanus]TYT74553.1 sensor domain-containing diguanylate cyclase [Desulfobotulus mexicanus]
MGPLAEEMNQPLESKALLACLEVGKTLTSTLDLNEILQLIMEKISSFVAAEHWSLLLRNEDSGELSFKIIVGIDKEFLSDVTIEKGRGIAGYVAESGESLFVPSVKNDPRFFPGIDAVTGFETRSAFCLPLCIHGKVLGVIEILNLEDVKIFKELHLPILMLLADYAAIAIRNAQFLDHIRLLSITDEYTGLYNARYMHELLEKMLHALHTENKKAAVVFMDMDHFKTVVDTRGHLMGSEVLREVGQTVKAALSKKDIVIKYGGDEYVMIFPDCNRINAHEKCTKILNAIRRTPFLQSDPQPPVHVTASLGFAIYPDDAVTRKELLLLADQAMYKAKKRGKNSVVSWAEEGNEKA